VQPRAAPTSGIRAAWFGTVVAVARGESATSTAAAADLRGGAEAAVARRASAEDRAPGHAGSAALIASVRDHGRELGACGARGVSPRKKTASWARWAGRVDRVGARSWRELGRVERGDDRRGRRR
jgi:hypothetical protein